MTKIPTTYKRLLAAVLSIFLSACGPAAAWAQLSTKVVPVSNLGPGFQGAAGARAQNMGTRNLLAPVSPNMNLGSSALGVNVPTVVPSRGVAAPQAAVSARQDSLAQVSGRAVANVVGQPSRPAAETAGKTEAAVASVSGELGPGLERTIGDSQATKDVLDQAYGERRAGMDALEPVMAAAGNRVVSPAGLAPAGVMGRTDKTEQKASGDAVSAGDAARTELAAKIERQVAAAVEVVSRSFGELGSAKDRILRKLRFWTWKPVGSRTFKQKPDSIDKALYGITKSYQVEFGRFEARNGRGETLGRSLFTSAGANYVEAADPMIEVFAQAWATGDFFDIKEVVFTHTHPSMGDSDFFSGEDIRAFNAIKTWTEALGLEASSLEASILYEGFSGRTIKKTLSVPASASIANGSYASRTAESLRDPKVRLALMYSIADIGDKIANGKLSQAQLVMKGLQPHHRNALASILKSK